MNRPLSSAHRIAIVSILLGVAGDALLRKGPWGLNAALWLPALLTATFLLDYTHRAAPRSWSHKALLGIAMIFALTFAWRDSPTLKLLSGSMVLVAVSLASGMIRGAFSLGRIRIAQCFSAGADLARSFALVPRGAMRSSFAWIRTRNERRDNTALGILRGLLLAAPLLLLFGALFASADASFEHLVLRLFDFDLGKVTSHAMLTLIFGCVAATFLQVLLYGCPRTSNFEGRLRSGGVGLIEINTLMMTIDGLFLAFIAVQIPWFFGGHDRVLTGSGLTYAEYARRGFFELVVVASLAFALLLTLDNVLQDLSGRKKTGFRLLSHGLVLLTAVVIASALYRMHLYRAAYGLTELRLYVTAFILWLAFAFVWLSLTLLRGKADRLAPGMLASGFAAALMLIAINPDAIIVRANVERVADGRRFDVDYAVSLSADAVPALVEALPTLPECERDRVARELHHRWTPESFDDWRSASWGRHRAQSSLAKLPA